MRIIIAIAAISATLFICAVFIPMIVERILDWATCGQRRMVIDGEGELVEITKQEETYH